MKILIIRLSSLGDVVLTQSFAAFLRQRYPEAEIHFLTKKAFSEICGLMGCNLKTIVYDKSLEAHLKLSKEKYDLVFDLHNKFSSFLIRLLARGKKTFVYDKQRSLRKKIVAKKTNSAIYSTVQLYASALRPLFGKISLPHPILYPPKKEIEPILPENKKLVLIFPAAAHKTKQYPHFKELIPKSDHEYYYILAGSPAENAYCESIRRGLEERCLNIAGKYNFSELLSIINKVDWLISGDSGPMHLAAALSKKQIAIFGATHPRLGFAPLNPNAIIVSKELECQPCSLHGGEKCPLKHFQCMLSIEAEDILRHI